MGSILNDTSMHKRYYLFMHLGAGEGLRHYNQATDSWEDEFPKATLFDSQDDVVDLAKMFSKSYPAIFYCVGCVDVTVDPYFGGIAIKDYQF